jgi:UDP-glucose 4-epimerase
MKNILITGIAGLIGSRFSKWILDNTNYSVIGIDDLSGGYIENVDKRAKFYNINISAAQKEIYKIFEDNDIEIIYHFAAYAAEGLSPFIRKFNYENNLISSANLINAAIKYSVKRFVFTSSMAVYGDKNQAPFSEEMQPMPIDPYGIAKYAVELDLKCAYEQHGLKYTIIRPHNVYGIGQNIWDKYRNVLGIWMYQLLNDIQPSIFGDGLQKRSFSYIDDSLLPLWNASQNENCVGETINLGGIKETTIIDAYCSLMNVTGLDITPKFYEPRHETKYAWSTWEKSSRLLNFEHKTDLEEGLAKMWEWAQKQPHKTRKAWDQYEIDNGLYECWKK